MFLHIITDRSVTRIFLTVGKVQLLRGHNTTISHSTYIERNELVLMSLFK